MGYTIDYIGEGSGMEPIPSEAWSDVDPHLVVKMMLDSLTPEGKQYVAEHGMERLTLRALANLCDPTVISDDLQGRLDKAMTGLQETEQHTNV